VQALAHFGPGLCGTSERPPPATPYTRDKVRRELSKAERFGYLFHEVPLKDRLERANRQLTYTYRRKTRLARVGVETCPLFELRLDLYAAAGGENGLFAEALYAYFLMLHRTERR
jgi:hypothetical protein